MDIRIRGGKTTVKVAASETRAINTVISLAIEARAHLGYQGDVDDQAAKLRTFLLQLRSPKTPPPDQKPADKAK